MNKKATIFKHLAVIYRRNPWVVVAFLWAGLLPSLGGLLFIRVLYLHWGTLTVPSLLDVESALVYVLSGAVLMGFALIPTTLFAVLSGFVFGWEAFPFMVLGYTLASGMGYLSGKALEKDSLPWLLQPYPKAKRIIEQKKEQMGWLVFFVRISPVIPFAISNLVFALLNSGLQRVLWFGLLGMLPRTFLAFLTGTLAGTIQQAINAETTGWHYPGIGLLLLISLWGIYRFFKR